MTTSDHDAADRLDDYLDRLAHGDGQPPAGLPPWLTATARAVRTQHEAPAPDPRFVARLRETLLMDASIPLPNPAARSASPLNGHAPSRADDLPPLPLSAADRRHRDARRHLATSTTPTPVPTAIGARRSRRNGPAQRWNRLVWPVVELLGAAALIVGLVSVLIGGNGGGGLPALVPGVGQTTEVATPTVAPVAAGEVAMAQGNAGRTGEMPGPGVGSSPEVAWSRMNDGSTFSSAPIVVDGTVYIFSGSDVASQVNAYDEGTGNLRWQYGVTDGRLESSVPAVADGLLLVPLTDFPAGEEFVYATPGVEPAFPDPAGRLVAIDLATGQERWTFTTRDIGYLSPLVIGHTAYVTDGQGLVQAVSLANGTAAWETRVTVAGNRVDGITIPNASLSAADGLVYLATNTGTLYAFDAMTGDERWEAELGGNTPTTPVVVSGVVYITSGMQTALLGPPAAAPAEDVDSTSITEGEGRLFAINATTGEALWTRDLDFVSRNGLSVADGIVILSGAGTDAGTILAVDAATGSKNLWSIDLAGYINAPVVVSDGIGYVGSFGTDLAAIDLAYGQILWSVVASDVIYSAAYVSDGFVVVATAGQRSTLYAIRASEVATPEAQQNSPIDISGLPPCAVTPRPSVDATPGPETSGAVPTVELPNATPALTLPDIDTGEYQTQQPAIAWGEIPIGDTAPQDAIAGISMTLQQMQTCDRPGNGRYVAAYYTDDYFLRPWVVWNLAFNGYGFWHAPAGDISPTTIAGQSRQLPDGRIAVIRTVEENPDYAQLFVFAEQGGQWLVDEFVEVTSDGVFRGG